VSTGLIVTPAFAAKPDPRVSVLQRQVRVLKTQNAALTARLDQDEAALTALGGRLDQIQTSQTALGDRITIVAAIGLDRSTCYYALNWDTFGGFWHLFDLLAQAAVGAQPAPPWPSFDDKGACSRIGVTRRAVAFRLNR
jgi:hypothetical protein